MASRHQLISIFGEVRELLSRPDNNFDWSGWDDSAEALEEMEPIRVALLKNELLPESRMAFFFLPTGPLQEVSISSGWGDEFIDLANRFDAALVAKDCPCFTLPQVPELKYEDRGTTQFHVELSLATCPQCGQNWLHCFYEHEAFTASGRWYLGAITQDQAKGLDSENALPVIKSLEWVWCGGSYFNDGRPSMSSGEVALP